MVKHKKFDLDKEFGEWKPKNARLVRIREKGKKEIRTWKRNNFYNGDSCQHTDNCILRQLCNGQLIQRFKAVFKTKLW